MYSNFATDSAATFGVRHQLSALRDECGSGTTSRATSVTVSSGRIQGLASTRAFEPGGWIGGSFTTLLHPHCRDIFRVGKARDRRPPDVPPPPPGGRDPCGAARPQLRAHDRHGLGQEPHLHRSDRRPRPPQRLGQGHQGDRRLPDERAGEQPGEGAREVPQARLPGQPAPVTFAATPARRARRRTREILAQSAGHPAHQLRDAGAGAHAAHERRLVGRPKGLHFLVLDELHTYRGRQGADVAMLVRRVREACGSTQLQMRRHLGDDGSGGHREERAGRGVRQ